jgi:hypothetical protein
MVDRYANKFDAAPYVLASDYDKLAAAAREVIESCDLSCLRASEEISIAEGCPCPVCVLKRFASDAAAK